MKKTILYTLFSFLTLLTYAQTPNLLISGGGTGEDYGHTVAVDDVGNMYVAGQFQNTATFGTQSVISAGIFDVFVAKYDPSGTCLWAKRAGSTDNDVCYGIAVSGSSVYITGRFTGTANFNTPSAFGSNEIVSAGGLGNTDILVAKYDTDGNFQWARRAGAAATQSVGQGIAISGTSVYIVGHFTGTANFNNPSATGSNEISAPGLSDIFLAKYDENGNFQWARRAGDFGIDYGYGICVNGNSIYITGQFQSSANFNTPYGSGTDNISAGSSSPDMFIAKYDNNGNFQWAKRAGGNSNDAGFAVAASGTSVYVTGYFTTLANFNNPSSSGSNELTGVGANNPFLAKYDENGNFQWARRSGNSTFAGTGVATLSNFVYVTGYFNGVPMNFSTPYTAGVHEISTAGVDDVFLVKYDDSGEVKAVKRAGGTNNDQAKAIATKGSSVYVVGNFISSVANFNTPSSFGTNEITGNGNNDVFLARYSDNSALPIVLKSFQGERINDKKVELTWQTAQEFGSKGFETQMSSEGRNFKTFHFVESKNLASETTYHITWENSDDAYYRLKQVDFDGKTSYSNIIFIKNTKNLVLVYPNPTDGIINLDKFKISVKTDINIKNILGQVVLNSHILPNQKKLNLQHLAKGTYFIEVLMPTKQIVRLTIE